MGQSAERLAAFLSVFRRPFEVNKKSLFKKAQWIVEGLLSSPQKNLQVIAQTLGKSDQQALHHFLSNSRWSWDSVCDLVAVEFYKLVARLKGLNSLCLIIDECGIPKKGQHSAGVGWQHCGATGKNDNCQVGVFAALNCGALTCLIKGLLFLPQSWTSDKLRLEKVEVPSSARQFKTKIQLAFELILDVKNRLKIPFQWVVFDAFYGRAIDFLNQLHQQGVTFLAQVPQTHHVFLKNFQLYVPKRKGPGRKPTKIKPNKPSIQVRQYASELKKPDWKKIAVRKTSTGVLYAFYHSIPVWVLDEKTLIKNKFVLLIRKDMNGQLSFHLTNSHASLQRLAYMQAQRHFVERAFRDAKQQLGMDQYQVRSYPAWHKHMALVMMAQLFIQLEKSIVNPSRLAVSTQDIVKMLILLLIPPPSIVTISQQIVSKNKLLFAKIRYLTK